jgi:light-regulated signal transduction histidine kinase (bacteriophytochrome)
MTVQQKCLPDSGIGVGGGKATKAAAFMPHIVYECSLDLVVTAMSPNALKVIGIRPENIVGKRIFWDERLLPEDRGRVLARLNRLAWAEVASEAHKITDDRGLPVWVAHSFQKMKGNQGARIHGCLVPLPDDFRATLDHSIISQFVHKIGNHFQLINLLIGSLKRTGTNLDEIEAVQQTIDKAVEFTRSFSHFSQSLVSPSAVDLAEILRSAVRSMAPSFFEKNIVVKDIVEQSLDGATISGDAFLLEFAFGALFHNALEATSSGEQILIHGRSEGTRMEGRAIAHIVVADTGCGIEKDALAKAAEPFFTSKRDRDGLGLSSAIRIFEMHGGTVNISSTLGQGTEVQVLLPIDGGSEQVRNGLINKRKQSFR